MATHLYDNPGPRTTRTREAGTPYPVTTFVELRDGVDHLTLMFSDLDALDETVRLFQEARTNHIDAMLAGRSEEVDPAMLEQEDLAVIDNELVSVMQVALDTRSVVVTFARKYEGLWNETEPQFVTLARSEKVLRLLPNSTLQAVS